LHTPVVVRDHSGSNEEQMQIDSPAPGTVIFFSKSQTLFVTRQNPPAPPSPRSHKRAWHFTTQLKAHAASSRNILHHTAARSRPFVRSRSKRVRQRACCHARVVLQDGGTCKCDACNTRDRPRLGEMRKWDVDSAGD